MKRHLALGGKRLARIGGVTAGPFLRSIGALRMPGSSVFVSWRSGMRPGTFIGTEPPAAVPRVIVDTLLENRDEPIQQAFAAEASQLVSHPSVKTSDHAVDRSAQLQSYIVAATCEDPCSRNSI
jgi:hypothetical protein